MALRSLASLERGALLAVLLATAIAGIALLATFLWPPRPDRYGPGKVAAGRVEEIPIGRPVQNLEGRFWLVRLDAETFLALSWRDPFRGCTVPWRPEFTFGEVRGWFRNPCHGQTYDLAGYCYFGPCVRGLDRYAVSIRDGEVIVDTFRREPGPPPRAENCLPSYPDVCISPFSSGVVCSLLPSDIKVFAPDPFALDPDTDGVGCES